MSAERAREEELLHAYHDGELGEAERVEFERRLAADAALAERLAAIRGVDGALELLPVAIPTTDFTRAVRTDASLELLPETSPSVGFTDEAVLQASVDRALDLLPGTQAPADFVDEVVTRASAEAGAARKGRLLRMAGAFAAAAAVLAGVLLLRDPPVQTGSDEAAFVPYEWETDGETYPSMALDDLEDEILKELGAT